MEYLPRIRSFIREAWVILVSKTPSDTLCPDTTSASILHKLSRRLGPSSKPPKLVRLYLLAVSVTYLPLLLAAILVRLPPWAESESGTLTFFQDWGLGYALVVSLPSLMVLLVSDDRLLSSSISEVERDGVITLSESDARSFSGTWTRNFRIWNLVAQIAGIGLGTVFGIVTLGVYVCNPGPSWIAPGGELHLASYVYLYCIILFYALIIVYVTRSIIISFFLRALVEAAPLRLLPLHPDKCGGLRRSARLTQSIYSYHSRN